MNPEKPKVRTINGVDRTFGPSGERCLAELLQIDHANSPEVLTEIAAGLVREVTGRLLPTPDYPFTVTIEEILGDH